MFTVQYWNGHDLAWKGTGSGTFYDKSQAIQKMKALAEMTDFSVRFRVEEVTASAV